MTEEEFMGRKIEKKDTNPKDAVGVRKAGMSCVPSEVLLELGLAMQEGARKYGRHNYRAVGVRASVYYDAVWRHLTAWWEGEDIDPESGLHHVTKAMAGLAVLRDSIHLNNWVDDRPPSLTTGWQGELNKKASDLIDRLPNSKDAYVKEPVKVSPGEITWIDDSSTTPQLRLPYPDNPVPTPAIQGYIDPKQHTWNPLLEREVPEGSVDILQVVSRK